MLIRPDSNNNPVPGETETCFLSNPYTAQVVPINTAINGKLPMLKNNMKHAININDTDIILLQLSFSFKKKNPKIILIIGVKKYPNDAS